jgi:hypothetical protein
MKKAMKKALLNKQMQLTNRLKKALFNVMQLTNSDEERTIYCADATNK